MNTYEYDYEYAYGLLYDLPACLTTMLFTSCTTPLYIFIGSGSLIQYKFNFFIAVWTETFDFTGRCTLKRWAKIVLPWDTLLCTTATT